MHCANFVCVAVSCNNLNSRVFDLWALAYCLTCRILDFISFYYFFITMYLHYVLFVLCSSAKSSAARLFACLSSWNGRCSKLLMWINCCGSAEGTRQVIILNAAWLMWRMRNMLQRFRLDGGNSFSLYLLLCVEATIACVTPPSLPLSLSLCHVHAYRKAALKTRAKRNSERRGGVAGPCRATGRVRGGEGWRVWRVDNANTGAHNANEWHANAFNNNCNSCILLTHSHTHTHVERHAQTCTDMHIHAHDDRQTWLASHFVSFLNVDFRAFVSSNFVFVFLSFSVHFFFLMLFSPMRCVAVCLLSWCVCTAFSMLTYTHTHTHTHIATHTHVTDQRCL